MRCPFLKESRVKFCEAVPIKKVIELTTDSIADLCRSSAFQDCAAFRKQEGSPSPPPCPFLRESRAQVCSQDPAVRRVPCSDQVLPRCVTANHHFCESYLAGVHPSHPVAEERGEFATAMPSHYFFTRNHMWLDVSDERDCHVGLDALLTQILGRVDKLSFITSEGQQCPSVLLLAHGLALHMLFPHPMRITCCNTQARVGPERLLHDPYGAGWLFEGFEAAGTDIRSGLLSGDEAKRWMVREVHRASELIRRYAADHEVGSNLCAADGGFPVEGALSLLQKEGVRQFFNELFRNEEAL